MGGGGVAYGRVWRELRGLRVVLWLHAHLGLVGIRVAEQFALKETLEQLEVAEDAAVSILRGHMVEKIYESETVMRSSYSNMSIQCILIWSIWGKCTSVYVISNIMVLFKAYPNALQPNSKPCWSLILSSHSPGALRLSFHLRQPTPLSSAHNYHQGLLQASQPQPDPSHPRIRSYSVRGDAV